LKHLVDFDKFSKKAACLFVLFRNKVIWMYLCGTPDFFLNDDCLKFVSEINLRMLQQDDG